MTQRTYSEKLRDPRWQKMRLQVLERDDWRCSNCEDESRTLHVHHIYYEAGKEPWEYPIEALTSLCEDCHATVHTPKDTAVATATPPTRTDSLQPESLELTREDVISLLITCVQSYRDGNPSKGECWFKLARRVDAAVDRQRAGG